jgi:hypothetical protein
MACADIGDSSAPLDMLTVQGWQMNAEECVDWCRDYIRPGWLVFMERFFITARTAELSSEGSHNALDVIGTVKNICRWNGAGFEFQTANDAKNFVSNQQLKTLGLWRPNEDHARDALRHLVRGIVWRTAGETCEDLKRQMT